MDETYLPISGAVEYFIAVFATIVVKQLKRLEIMEIQHFSSKWKIGQVKNATQTQGTLFR